MKELLDFIARSPSPYHAAENVCETLSRAGFERLYEHDEWRIGRGGCYYAVRGGSSVIAFSVPECEYAGLAVCASHTDSPSFKIKSTPEIPEVNGLVRLNIEGYGGMAKESWFDRPLSVAGRAVVGAEDGIEYRTVDIDRDLLVIPSLAVHMGKPREGDKVNIQTELLPILRGAQSPNSFLELAAEAAGIEPGELLGFDLYLYNREKGTVFGADKEFIASPRIDNLESVYLSLEAFIASEKTSDKTSMLKVFAAFNNEETGSLSRQGTESTFFSDVMERVNESLGVSGAEYKRRLASSFIMSADNAHAAHPNYISKADPEIRPRLNGGVVIKHNASARYTTDAVSAAVVKKLCASAGVPYQDYHNRSDIAGGSTLGNLMNRYISVHSADIGLAQLAMHSAYETAGAKDPEYMKALLLRFYGSEFCASENGLCIK